MSLATAYVQSLGNLPELFNQIRQGQAPEQFTAQHLKDLGFRSSSHRLFLPLLKALGFLSADGRPTARYHDYRSDDQSAKRVMGQALREAYSDLFVLRTQPSESDRRLFEGKFKSVHNTTDRMAKIMTNTFFALLPLADLSHSSSHADIKKKTAELSADEKSSAEHSADTSKQKVSASLHYNIQIHLPPTKDIEVYNSIFKSLKEHLLE